jgi:hypothetical protein
MTTLFKPRLYLFSNEYDEAIERIFGKENIQVMELNNYAIFEDEVAEKLNELTGQFYDFYKCMVTVENYTNEQITMFSLAGAKSVVYKIDNEDLVEDLDYWHESFAVFVSWGERRDEYLSAQELLVDNAHGMFDDDVYGNMYNSNLDIADMSDNIENLCTEGFKDSFDEKFRMKTY